MRTVTFKSVWERVLRLVGIDPATAALSADREEFFADLINERVAEAWEYTFWPELCVSEERTPDADEVIGYDQADEIALGEVMGVWTKDPDRYSATARELAFLMTADGIQLTDENETIPSTVWVKYRRRPNRFTKAAFSGTGSYSVGDLVYYGSDCYQAALVDGSEVWLKVSFPYFLANAVAHGAAADYLRQDGQRERADIEDGLAGRLLEDAAAKAGAQQGAVTRARVVVE
jgi:hypothetical protein